MPSRSHSSRISRSKAARSRRQGEATSGFRATREGDEISMLKIVRQTPGTFVANKLSILMSGRLDQTSPSIHATIQSPHEHSVHSNHAKHGYPLPPPSIDLAQMAWPPPQGPKTPTSNVLISMPTAAINAPTQKRTPMTNWHTRNPLPSDQLSRKSPPTYANKLIFRFSRNRLRSSKTS